jgi:O-glycosyl hydrolase
MIFSFGRHFRFLCPKILATLLVFLLAQGGCGGSGSSSTNPPAAPAATVTLDPSERHQRIEGFGAGVPNWAAPTGHLGCSPPTDTVPQQVKSQILDLLYSDLGLTTVQSSFSPSATVNLSALALLLPTFSAAAQRVQAQGDRVVYNFDGPVTSEFRDSTGRLLPGGATLYATGATNGLVQLKTQYGLSIDRWDIQEEPDGAGNLLPSELQQLVAATGPQFKAAGLSTRITIPRTVTVANVTAWSAPALNDPSSSQYVSQLAFHEYDYDASLGQTPDIPDRQAVASSARQLGLTVAMRETSTDVKQNRLTFWNGTYDQAMAWANDILTDMTEADAVAWDLIHIFWIRDNARGFGVDSYIVLDYSNCVFTNFEIPPLYWTLRQVTKFVRQGAVRIGARSDSADVRAAAFVDARHQQTVIVAINNATQARAVRFTGVPNGPASVTQTTQNQNGAQLPAISVQGGQFTSNLPARSVTTFVF